MQEIYDWIEEKLNHGVDTIFEPISVSIEYKKIGGLFHYAKLSIDIRPSEEFSLEIDSNEDDKKFDQAIKNALFGFLMGRSHLPLLGVSIRVYDIKSDPINSSYFAFHAATKLALHQAFNSK